jgi:uncharacterized lipoprotein YddW (UPF0748 family)
MVAKDQDHLDLKLQVSKLVVKKANKVAEVCSEAKEDSMTFLAWENLMFKYMELTKR